MEGLAPATPPQTEERLRWLDLIPVLGVTVLGIVLVFFVLVALARLDRSFSRSNLETIALSATLAAYLAFGTGIAVALRRLRAPLAFLGLRWPTLRDLGLTLALVVPWYIGIAVVSALSSVALNGGHVVPGNSRQLFVEHPRGLGILLLALLVTAVAAPLCEEAFFRGMLFRLLRRRAPLWAAVLLSAMAFGLAHASPAVSLALLPVFTYMGIVLALVYAWTGSLTNTVLLHALNNAVGTVAVYTLLAR
ncbi:MAG TPA: type II CAAX endopeptidase family protein [Candidatus Dormibacteraeota bacterium]|nr:type II CAAX endopeptidase family protein [Candidatus Dormibacteraeota bacterium]